MIYKLQDSHYRTFSTIQVARLPRRSYFIPYPSRREQEGIALTQKRYCSSKVVCLNGQWDFHYYADPNDLMLEFDSDNTGFDKLEVPSCWQYRGYGKPAYLNVHYPFAYRPPVIPTTEPVGLYFSALDGFRKAPSDEMNHVGVYRTFFEAPEEVRKASRQYVISFLGVCSCLEVHVNGRFVGYSEESHNTAEFDLTPYVVQGRNELVCVVRRWCNGSYLEDQDMFRNNGIFRDVLLRISGGNDIWDIDWKTSRHGSCYDLEVSATVLGSPEEVVFTLEGHGLQKSLAARVQEGVARAVFKDLEVLQWNAEDPVLYDLYIEVPGTCIHESVGFRTIEISGNRYLLNGHLVKFKGVNHHDTDPRNGYCMSPEQIKRDLELCKAFNADTVRTSHYAPDPLLLELAAVLGIYIVDEVDLETHGVLTGKLPPSYNRLSNNPKWKKHYLSRAEGHYGRDKALKTPVIMWSLGNESGGGCNTDAMYDYFCSMSDIPVHYESAIYTKRKAYDIASRMYPPVSELHDIAKHKCRTRQFMDRPYFMCEYAHAMGVGPGNIEGYWKEIYSCDGLIGGCIWEMNDHAVEHEDGSYTYGGDHGEWIHDGNFCCDGLFYPDRSPSTGAWIMRHAYRPIRISRIEGDLFEIFNTTAFTPGSSFVMKIRLSNGLAFDHVPEAGPLERVRVRFDLGDTSGDCFLTADTYDSTGRLVSTEQILLNESILKAEGETGLRKGGDLPLWFDVVGGNPVVRDERASASSEPLMCASEPYTLLFRAQTDNDTVMFRFHPIEKWYGGKVQMLGCRRSPDASRIVTEWAIKVKAGTLLCTDLYEGCTLADGTPAVLVTTLLHPLKVRRNLPRFAKSFALDESFDSITYLGRTGESYVDMKEQFPVDLVHTTVDRMTEPNIRPQESGNRTDTRFVEVSDGNTVIRFDAVDKPFELSVKPYSDAELALMKHRCDERRTGTYVTINALQQGIGTGSCGPNALAEHCYPASKDYMMRFAISLRRQK